MEKGGWATLARGVSALKTIPNVYGLYKDNHIGDGTHAS